MITIVEDNNRTIEVVTQQYKVGTYVALYDHDTHEFLDQFGIELDEKEYHKQIRKKFSGKTKTS